MRKPKEWWVCLLPGASDEMIPCMYAIGKMMLYSMCLVILANYANACIIAKAARERQVHLFNTNFRVLQEVLLSVVSRPLGRGLLYYIY